MRGGCAPRPGWPPNSASPFELLIVRHATLVDPAGFQPVPVPALGPDATGWMHIPGATAAGASILPFDRTG